MAAKGTVGQGLAQPRQKFHANRSLQRASASPSSSHFGPNPNSSSPSKMSSSAPRGAERMIHQDYIARIRYSNALPPPPNPPKLLDIPNTGLASGQYTTPGFASRLAREQPLNIEADAELGMPLDLVGMPGIFDGDESCKSISELFLRYNHSPFL